MQICDNMLLYKQSTAMCGPTTTIILDDGVGCDNGSTVPVATFMLVTSALVLQHNVSHACQATLKDNLFVLDDRLNHTRPVSVSSLNHCFFRIS